MNTVDVADNKDPINVYEQAVKSAYSDQDENGIDLFHLRANLRLTPTERLERNRMSHQLLMEVRRAGATARLRRDTSRS